jgi:hypothetical protein
MSRRTVLASGLAVGGLGGLAALGLRPLTAAAQAPADAIKVRWDSYAPEFLDSDTLVVKWSQQFLIAIRVIAPPPTVASRHLALLHTAMYDAWAAYDGKAVGTRLGGALRRPPAERTDANRDKAISYAAYLMAVDQFQTQKDQFRRFMRKLGYDPDQTTLDRSSPIGIARSVIEALCEYRHRDGSNQLGDMSPRGLYTDYTGFSVFRAGEGTDKLAALARWQPLVSGNGMGGFTDIDARLRQLNAKPRQRVTVELGGYNTQRPTTPFWGNVLPFAMDKGSALRPLAPLAVTQADLVPAPNEDNDKYADVSLDPEYLPKTFREQCRQLLAMSARLTDEQKSIVEYWADGPLSETPPGHWNVLAHYVSRRDRHTLEQDVKMFFVLGNALMDAGIGCWDAKRYYDYVRPVAAIRQLFQGQTVRAWMGPVEGITQGKGEAWRPYQELYFVTPAFQEYTSGHSTFTTAAANSLRLFKGNDRFGAFAVVQPGSSAIEVGRTPAKPVTLRWGTFTDAAVEASMSRRYGGLHFAQGDLEGRRMGRLVAEAVWNLAQQHFEGTAPIVTRKFTNLYAEAAG